MILKAIALNGTLKPSGGQPSSTDRMLDLIMEGLREKLVEVDTIRLADHNIKPGVTSDEGQGMHGQTFERRFSKRTFSLWELRSGSDNHLRSRNALWNGWMPFWRKTDEEGRMVSYGKVAAVAVVGNEDGAHHVSAEIYQALNDVGFTIPANAVAYWVGEAMGSKDFVDLEEVPEVVTNAADMSVRNTVHLAHLLQEKQYPGEK